MPSKKLKFEYQPTKTEANISFFRYGLLSRTFTNCRTPGDWECHFLNSFYHFHLAHRHLTFNQTITAESSTSHIAAFHKRWYGNNSKRLYLFLFSKWESSARNNNPVVYAGLFYRQKA